MAYFTTVLQRQVNDFWRKKIEQADAEMRIYTTGKEIRDYLNNRSTLCTVGYVIRRHLQKNFSDLLESVKAATGCDYADLFQTLNVPWPEPFNIALAKELKKLAKEKGLNISRNTWLAYLDDEPIRMYKDTPFKTAFVLSMNIETTEELLMACGQDTYCFRNPDHFIYYYCQSRPSAFSWTHAQKLLTRYRAGLESDRFTANDASTGMTQILRTSLKKLFANPAPDEEADTELIEYMLQHQQEFSSLSLTARENFLRMAQYLSVLYPTYRKASARRKSSADEDAYDTEETPVSLQPDGTPRLSELVRALFNTGGWLPTTIGRYNESEEDRGIRTASSIKRRESSSNIEYRRAPIDENSDRPFMNSVQYFVDSYAHHLDAIDRVYRRPDNPGNVERRDVILFTYFFIRRYPELLMDEDACGQELDQLTSLAYGDRKIDYCMDQLMEELYNLTSRKLEETAEGSYDEGAGTHDYLDLFNQVLRIFGMKGMYMPNPWDRFITLSLFAEDPDFVTEAVLWNTVADEEEEETDEPSIEPDEFSTEVTESSTEAAAFSTDNKEFSTETEEGFTTIDGLSTNREETAAETKELFSHPEETRSFEPVSLCITNPNASPVWPHSSGSIHPVPAMLRRQKTGECIPIQKCCFIFGRLSSHSSDFQDYGFPTDQRSISRAHAAILFSEGVYYLADLSSKHKTWLNERHLNTGSFSLPQGGSKASIHCAYPLQSGDNIRLVNEEFEFLLK